MVSWEKARDELIEDLNKCEDEEDFIMFLVMVFTCFNKSVEKYSKIKDKTKEDNRLS